MQYKTQTCVGATCGGTNYCSPGSTQQVSQACNTQSCPVAGACGPAATNYGTYATGFSGAYCGTSNTGNPAYPSFPSPGSSSTWTCTGWYGGSTASCTATRRGYPSVDLKVNSSDGPISVAKPSWVSVSWNVANVDSCTPTNWSGFSGNSGYTSDYFTGQKPYYLACRQSGQSDITDTVVVNETFAYTLSTNGGISAVAGSSGGNTLTVTKTAGVGSPTPSVSFSASGLPFQASANFSPASCSPSISPTCTSSITVNTSAQTPAGTHPITISGSLNGITTTFNLIVTTAPMPTVDIVVGTVPNNYDNGPLNLSLGSPPNGKVYLYWQTTNANSCTASGNWSGSKASGGTGSETISGLSNADYTYTLTCSNNMGSSSDSVIVRGYFNVSVLIYEQSTQNQTITIPYNTGTTIEWTSGGDTRGVTCVASGDWNGTKAANGTYATGNLVANKTYGISCSNPVSSQYDSMSVSVGTPPTLSVSISPSPTSGNSPLNDILIATVGGTAAGTINYNFWYNCTNTSVIVSSAEQACGPLPVGTSGTCAYNSIGARCQGVYPNPLAVSAQYTCTSGTCTYKPKVIVERGSASPAQAIGTVNVTVAPVTASCSVDKTQATIREPVTWVATASGGNGTYTYTWGGTSPLSGKTGAAVTLSGDAGYTSAGIKTGSVKVSSGGQTATANCSNSVTVYQPAVRVEQVNGFGTGTALVKEGETLQLYAKYYKFGIVQGDQTNLTSGVTWDSLYPTYATVNNTGLVTAKSTQGITYINIVYTDPYGNLLLTNTGTRLKVEVTALDPVAVSISNPNAPNNPVTNQNITFTATGGKGTYNWTASGGSPASGSGSTFTTSYGTTGVKTITVKSGSQQTGANVTIDSAILSIDRFSFTPNSGKIPLSTAVSVSSGGNIAGGTTNYSIWWNCANTTTSVAAARAQCGTLPTPQSGTCVANSVGAKCDAMAGNADFNYALPAAGNLVPKVIAEKSGTSVQRQTAVYTVGVDIKANLEDGPVTIDGNDSAILSWTSSNVQSCTASSDWSGAKNVSGSDSSGVLYQARPYTFTLTCKNTESGVFPEPSGSDSVVVNVRDMVVGTLSLGGYNAPNQYSPKMGVDMVAEITQTNIQNQKNNFTFYCDCADTSTNIGACGYVRKVDNTDAMSNTQVDACDYIDAGTYHPKVIIERGTAATAINQTITVEAVPPNQAPSVTPLAPSAPSDYCASPFGWALSWTFSDPLGESQSAYQVVITDTGTGGIVKDTGEVTSSSNSYSVPVGTLDFNKTYSWTIKVWDNHPSRLTAQSSGANFTTIKHAAPSLSAISAPARVSKDEILTLTDSTTVYGGSTKTAWDWDFSDVTDYTLLTPTNLNEVKVKFTTTGMKNVKFKVTDSDGLWCKKGFNDLPSDSLPDISVGRSVPTNFREISP